MIKVWADVGGTFTDCFVSRDGSVTWTKVLSTASVKGVVGTGSGRELIRDTLRAGDVDNFWSGCQLRILHSDGSILAESTVESSDGQSGAIRLAEPLDLPQVGVSYELASPLTAPILAARMLLRCPPHLPLPPMDVRLGTTRGTNALLTRSGASTALMTTEGFADLLEIGEQDRPDLFALEIVKRQPLCDLCVEVPERIAASGEVLKPLDQDVARQQMLSLHEQGIKSLAISLLNAYKNPRHEQALAALAAEIGFDNVSLSHQVAPLVKLVNRSETTVLDAYLNPVISDYAATLWREIGGRGHSRLRLMTSGGSLVPGDQFRGKDSILSGPAGGVVALGEVARRHRQPEAIGLDMGGTSTDVSRFCGQPVRHYESIKAGTRILTPMMGIETVAAGGGSICQFHEERLHVGPQSAGADPGPACYGRGGPLTVTDLNVVLGAVISERFPFPMDVSAARERLQEIHDQMNAANHQVDGIESLADGFRQIANHHMAEAVRSVTTAEGRDPREMALVGFGGAAGQHLCSVAEILGVGRIIDHPQSSLLSALGMGLAETGATQTEGIYQPLATINPAELEQQMQTLSDSIRESLEIDSLDKPFKTRQSVDLRYVGTEAALEVPWSDESQLVQTFQKLHRERFGYDRADHPLEVVAIRSAVTVAGEQIASTCDQGIASQSHSREEPRRIWIDGDWQMARVHDRAALNSGDSIAGPAIIASSYHTLVVLPRWKGLVHDDGSIVLEDHGIDGESLQRPHSVATNMVDSSVDDMPPRDPVLLEILASRFQEIASQMGLVLQRTAISVNIKERCDYSCAIFRSDGSLVANAPHVPVHLGAMGHTVRSIMQQFPKMYPGDCYVSNDPFAGGSHLPDVTTVSPVFIGQSERPDFFVASRAHHAEIGGISPGSMPPQATNLAQEGVLIRARPLVRQGENHMESLRELLSASRYPSRCVDENIADITAQQAAGCRGASDLVSLADIYGCSLIDRYMGYLQDLAAAATERFIEQLPSKTLRCTDHLDDGSEICVAITVRDQRIEIDFTGSSGVHPGAFNATQAIVNAAVLYVLRMLIDEELPLNDGVLRSVDLCLPAGLLNPPAHPDPERCPAVVAGNVETSQRVVDVLLGALGVAAASQGTMNNFLMGDESFGYYETIGGGSGATSKRSGASAVHTHMTNTRITDPEVLELRYPARVQRFAVRRGSGGQGTMSGGDGIVREIEFLKPLTVSLLTGRRGTFPPYGIEGGSPGTLGENWLINPDGRRTRLDHACSIEVAAGDMIVIKTPGGGGWGPRR